MLSGRLFPIALAAEVVVKKMGLNSTILSGTSYEHGALRSILMRQIERSCGTQGVGSRGCLFKGTRFTLYG